MPVRGLGDGVFEHAEGARALLPEDLLLGVEVTPMLTLTQLSDYLTLKGSFSAVTKPTFASKYELESSRRDLQNALFCTVLESVL